MPTQRNTEGKTGQQRLVRAVLHIDVTGAGQITYVALESRKDMQNIYMN